MPGPLRVTPASSAPSIAKSPALKMYVPELSGTETHGTRAAYSWKASVAATVRCAAHVAVWELKRFFLRPMTYALLLSLTVVSTWSFSWLVTLLARGTSPALRGDDDPVFQFLGPNLFLVGTGTLLIPLLTMSLVAEERRRGTWETLLTSAANPVGVLLGKFVAGWCQWLACLTPWVVLAGVLRLWNGETQTLAGFFPWFGGRGLDFDLGPLVGSLLGLALLGLTFVALGLFCSSVCRQTASAAALSFAAMLGVLFLSVLPKLLGYWNCSPEWLRLANHVSCWGHLEQFSQGGISPRIIAGHLSVCVLLLWGTILTARTRDTA